MAVGWIKFKSDDRTAKCVRFRADFDTSPRVVAKASREGFGFSQRKSRMIPRGKHRLAIQRPLNSDLRIIPNKTALVLGSVIIRGFIQDVRELGQDKKSVRESRWNPKLPVVVLAEFTAHPLTECWFGFAKIDGDVKYASPHHADEFSLRLPNLVMQTPEYIAD